MSYWTINFPFGFCRMAACLILSRFLSLKIWKPICKRIQNHKKKMLAKLFVYVNTLLNWKVGFSAVKYCKQVETSGFWLCIFTSQWTQTLSESELKISQFCNFTLSEVDLRFSYFCHFKRHLLYLLEMSSSWNFPARASPSYESSEPSWGISISELKPSWIYYALVRIFQFCTCIIVISSSNDHLS